MSFAIVAVPRFSPADLGWIESLRRRHLPDYERQIGPHLTLVFPFTADAEASTRTPAAAVAGATPPFSAAFRAVLSLPDAFSTDSVVALVPDEGMSHAIRLHDRLYTGPLADHLRLDLPFVPHVTVARMANARSAKALVDDLNGAEPSILAAIGEITLLRMTRPAIETAAVLRLGG